MRCGRSGLGSCTTRSDPAAETATPQHVPGSVPVRSVCPVRRLLSGGGALARGRDLRLLLPGRPPPRRHLCRLWSCRHGPRHQRCATADLPALQRTPVRPGCSPAPRPACTWTGSPCSTPCARLASPPAPPATPAGNNSSATHHPTSLPTPSASAPPPQSVSPTTPPPTGPTTPQAERRDLATRPRDKPSGVGAEGPLGEALAKPAVNANWLAVLIRPLR